MKLSAYQEAIIDHAKTSENDLLVNAKPGSGKTFTSVEVVNNLPNPESVLALAFTKTIAKSLEKKVNPLSTVTNSHTYGKSFLKRSAYYEKNKYWEFTNFNGKSLVNTHQVSSSFVLVRLLELIRLSDTDIFCDDKQAIRNLNSMAYDYGLLGIRCFDGELLDFARNGINWGIDWYKKTGQIDFADMLFLPVELNLDPPETYDYVIVDEVQDFSNIQIELMQLAVSDYGKLLMVGDQNQACFKFAGAGKASIPNIRERLQPDVLPLSICYRCPTSHIELANQIYPGMEARPDAPVGELYDWNDGYTQSQLRHLAGPGDLIICRRVAPLIEQCLDFILAEIPAVVKGRGVKESLFRTFDEIENQRGFKYSKVFEYADKWYDHWRDYFVNEYENPDNVIQDLSDRYNQVIACIQAFNATSFSLLKKQIEYIFSDKSEAIQLSSIHSAKGLEAETVFVMEADKLPFKFPGMTDDDRVQESNLEYIAKTRSMDKLYLLPKEEE